MAFVFSPVHLHPVFTFRSHLVVPPLRLTPAPQSPLCLTPAPQSPLRLTPAPQSPLRLTPRPQSPIRLTPRLPSPLRLTPRPQSITLDSYMDSLMERLLDWVKSGRMKSFLESDIVKSGRMESTLNPLAKSVLESDFAKSGRLESALERAMTRALKRAFNFKLNPVEDFVLDHCTGLEMELDTMKRALEIVLDYDKDAPTRG